MSEEKSYGQILWEKFCEQDGDYYGKYEYRHEATKTRWELYAQVIIEEFLRRSSEPVGYVNEESLIELSGNPDDSIGLIKHKSLFRNLPLFASPQPLQSKREDYE